MTTHQLLARIPPHTDRWDRRACSHRFAGTVSESMDLQKHEKSNHCISHFSKTSKGYTCAYTVLFCVIICFYSKLANDHRYLYTDNRGVDSGIKHSDRVRVSHRYHRVVHNVPGIGVNTNHRSPGRTDSVNHVLQSTEKSGLKKIRVSFLILLWYRTINLGHMGGSNLNAE